MNDFKPFANESDVIRIGAMEIENRIDRVSLVGDVVLTRDKVGLSLARELQALISQVVKTLESETQLPGAVSLQAEQVVKNPF